MARSAASSSELGLGPWAVAVGRDRGPRVGQGWELLGKGQGSVQVLADALFHALFVSSDVCKPERTHGQTALASAVTH